MNDFIAGIAVVESDGQKFTSDEELGLEVALNKLLDEIRLHNNVASADSSLSELAHLQTELARACFKWHVQLPPRLRQLVREFDRFDDFNLRLAVFKQIKKGAFLGK